MELANLGILIIIAPVAIGLILLWREFNKDVKRLDTLSHRSNGVNK